MSRPLGWHKAWALGGAIVPLLLMNLSFGEVVPRVLAASSLTMAAFSSPPLAIGGNHACALPGDGTVLCWGDDSSGQLGDGQRHGPSVPAPGVGAALVSVITRVGSAAPLTGVGAITAGFAHTCALLEDSTVRCWGANAPIAGLFVPAPRAGGALGDGTTVDRSAPVTVIAGLGQTAPLSEVKALSAAYGYTCALLQNGSAKCWGDAPQAGSLAPITVMADATHPLTGIVSIGAGDMHACALMADGSVVCWGADESGQLGDQGGEVKSAMPVKVTVSGAPTLALGGVSAIAVGHNMDLNENGIRIGHSCGLDSAGGVLCWGTNDASQLGNGSVGFSGPGGRVYAAPVVAAPGSADSLTGVAAIAAGNAFTCALMHDTSVKCWGLGFGGLRGIGAPVAISNLAGAVSIAAGGDAQLDGGQGCAVLADGTVKCWTGQPGTARVVAGLHVRAPSGQVTTTPTATPEAVIGEWQGIVAAGVPQSMAAEVTISFSGGTYSVTNIVAKPIFGTACHVPAAMVLATFSGTGGMYVGQEVNWNVADCSTISLPATFTLHCDTLTVFYKRTGVTTFWRRVSSAMLASTAFRNSVPTPDEINLSPAVVIETLALAGGVIILVPFPGALFNSTLRANYDEITRRARRARRRARNIILYPWEPLRRKLGLPSSSVALAEAVGEPAAAETAMEERHDFWWTPIGAGVFILLTALFSGFLDPSFGPNAASIATFVGMLIGLVIVLAAFDLPLAIFYRRHSIDFWLRALPATVAVSIACVLISRLTDFHPGYLYGLVIAIVAARKFDTATEGKLMAAGAASTIAIAVLSWIGLGIVSPLASAGPDPGPLLVITQTVLSMVVVAGVQLAAFGMLPLSFLAGESVKKWNRPVWAGLLAFGWIAFGIVILNPRNGYLSDATRTPLITIVTLLILFSVGSLLFWYYFHRHPAVETATGA